MYHPSAGSSKDLKDTRRTNDIRCGGFTSQSVDSRLLAQCALADNEAAAHPVCLMYVAAFMRKGEIRDREQLAAELSSPKNRIGELISGLTIHFSERNLRFYGNWAIPITLATIAIHSSY